MDDTLSLDLFRGPTYVDAQAFTPQRLTLARNAKGWTMTELAAEIRATPGAISQFESGTIKPSLQTLEVLSSKLDVPPKFFAAGTPPALAWESCHFRKLRGASKQEQMRVIAIGTMILEVLKHLEQRIEIPDPNLAPLMRTPADDDDVEVIAERVRDAWGLGFGPVSNMAWLVENKGILAVEIEGHSEKLDAFSAWTDNRPIIFLATEKQAATRRRFDIAHELGHLLMHDKACPGDQALERQANRFASAFLMPRKPFEAEFPRRIVWPHLLELKRRWKVSLEALLRRGLDLMLISDATYRRAYTQLSTRGWRGNEPAEPPMETPVLLPDSVQVLEQLGYTLERVAHDLPQYPPDKLRRLLQTAA